MIQPVNSNEETMLKATKQDQKNHAALKNTF